MISNPILPGFHADPSICRVPGTGGAANSGSLLDAMGYIVRSTRDTIANANANVADVFNSLLNMLSTGLSQRFGKRAVAITCFGLSTLTASSLYLLPATAVWGMAGLAFVGALVYAPTCAVMWSMYADAADYSEWQTGRRPMPSRATA